MQIYEDNNPVPYKINAYTDAGITVNHTCYPHSILLGLDKINPHWRPSSFQELTEQDLLEILAFTPEIILLGTGPHFIMPAPQQLQVLHQQKIGVECMDTRAACRTYLALSAEGRNVVAALLLK